MKRLTLETSHEIRKRQKIEVSCHGAMGDFLKTGEWDLVFSTATWKSKRYLFEPPPHVAGIFHQSAIVQLFSDVVSMADQTFLSLLGARELCSLPMVCRATYHACRGCGAYWSKCIDAFSKLYVGYKEHAALADIDPTISSFRAMRRRTPQINVSFAHWKNTRRRETTSSYTVILHPKFKTIIGESKPHNAALNGNVCRGCWDDLTSFKATVVEKRCIASVRFMAMSTTIPDTYIVRFNKSIKLGFKGMTGNECHKGDVAIITKNGFIGILSITYGLSKNVVGVSGAEALLEIIKQVAEKRPRCPLCPRFIEFC